MRWENTGIKIDGKWLSNLRFADDVALFAQSIENLQKMVFDLTETGRKAELKINAQNPVLLSKTDEWADIGLELTIKGERIKRLEEVIYLGQTLAFQDRLDRELTKRTSQAWNNF